MQPAHGVRFHFERASEKSPPPREPSQPSPIFYRLQVFAGPRRWVLLAAIEPDTGQISFQPGEPQEASRGGADRVENERATSDGQAIPERYLDRARAFLRAEWNTRRRDPDEPWPHSINRWRADDAPGAPDPSS